MKKELNLAQVFVATKAFLGKVYFDHYSDDLGIMHGGFAINKCKDNWQQEPETWDASVWIAWMKAANAVLGVKNINVALQLVSPLQGYQIMKMYLHDFAYTYEFQELITLFDQLNIDQRSDFHTSQAWKEWMLCVDATLENRLTLDGSLVSLETLVSKEQSFEIVQSFLQNEKALFDEDIKQMLKKIIVENRTQNNLYKIWLHIYNSFENKLEQKITLLQAYNATRMFVEKYFENDEKDLKTVQKKLAIDNEKFPVDYYVWFSWMQAVYTVVLG